MNDDELDKEYQSRFGKRPAPTDGDQEDLQEFFRDLVSAYVNFPNNLKLELKEGQRSRWALMVEPDVADYAIVAGKLGRNFNALKALTEVIAQHRGMTIELLLEGPPKDDNRFIRKQLPYRVNPQWTADELKALVARTLRVAGLKHIRLLLHKNRAVNESNPFNDQTFYWFTGMNSEWEENFAFHLGQLMESIGVVQGQRLTPRSKDVALEKTA